MIFTYWLCMKPIILYMPFGPSKKKIKKLLAYMYMYTITNRSPHNLQVFWKKKLRVNESLWLRTFTYRREAGIVVQ